MAGRLALCATPIGNLSDVTLRVLEEFRSADVILAEDTRHTAVLLRRHGIAAQLLSYHEHNELVRLPEVVQMLRAGQRVAVVSDAGTPGLADPGYRLIRAAIELGAQVTALPGPNAVLPALVLSGLALHRFAFLGFMPRGAKARGEELRTGLALPLTVVWYESPRRLQATLRTACDLGFGARPAAVARELTKVHEDVARGPLAHLAERFDREPPRGEVVLLVGQAAAGPAAPESWNAALREAKARRAAGEALPAAVAGAAGRWGVDRRALYGAVAAGVEPDGAEPALPPPDGPERG